MGAHCQCVAKRLLDFRLARANVSKCEIIRKVGKSEISWKVDEGSTADGGDKDFD